MSIPIPSQRSAFSPPAPPVEKEKRDRFVAPISKLTDQLESTSNIIWTRIVIDPESGEYDYCPVTIFNRRLKEYGATVPLLTSSGKPCAGTYGSIVRIVNMPKKLQKIQTDLETAIKEMKIYVRMEKKGVPHVPKLFDFFHTRSLMPSKSVMIIEDVGETLTDVYLDSSNQNKKRASMKQIRNLMRSYLTAVEKAHKANIAHFDITPSNLSAQGHIIDWGMAEKLDTVHLCQSIRTTLWYRPPEMELKLNYNEKVDIWSLGCVMYELFTGNPLFPIQESQYSTENMIEFYFGRLGLEIDRLPDGVAEMLQAAVQVSSNDANPASPVPIISPPRSIGVALAEYRKHRAKTMGEHLTDQEFIDFVFLLGQMLQFDPRERLSADESLRCPFFTEPNKVEKEEMKEEVNDTPCVRGD